MRSQSSVVLTHPHRRHSDHSSTPPTHSAYSSYSSHTPHSYTHHASQEVHPHETTPIYASSSLPSHTSLVASPPHSTPPHHTSPRRCVHTEQITTVELSSPEGHLSSIPLLYTPSRTISAMATPQTTPSHGMSDGTQLDTVSNAVYNNQPTFSRHLSTNTRHFRAGSTPQFSDNSTPLRTGDLFGSNTRLSTPASASNIGYEQSSRNSQTELSNHGALYSSNQNTTRRMTSSTRRPSNDRYSVEGEKMKRSLESFERRPSVEKLISNSKSGSSRFSRSSSFERQTREFDDDWSCPQCSGRGTSSTAVSPGGTRTQTRTHKCTQVYRSPTPTMNNGRIREQGLGTMNNGRISTGREQGLGTMDNGRISTGREQGLGTMDNGRIREQGLGTMDNDGLGTMDNGGLGTMDNGGFSTHGREQGLGTMDNGRISTHGGLGTMDNGCISTHGREQGLGMMDNGCISTHGREQGLGTMDNGRINTGREQGLGTMDNGRISTGREQGLGIGSMRDRATLRSTADHRNQPSTKTQSGVCVQYTYVLLCICGIYPLSLMGLSSFLHNTCAHTILSNGVLVLPPILCKKHCL